MQASPLMTAQEVELLTAIAFEYRIQPSFDQIVEVYSTNPDAYLEAYKGLEESTVEKILLTIRHHVPEIKKAVFTQPDDVELSKFALSILIAANEEGTRLNEVLRDKLDIHADTLEAEKVALDSMLQNVKEQENFDRIMSVVEMIDLRSQVGRFNAGVLSYGQAICRSEIDHIIEMVRTQHPSEIKPAMIKVMSRFIGETMFV